MTTGLTEGEPDFVNTPQAMIEAYGDGPDPLPVEVASLSTIWHRPRDFRTGGLEFDSGFGVLQVALDADNSPYTGHDGWKMMHRDGAVAFGKGRNEYVPSTPCEMYPEMRKAWDGWVGFILDAGVDGIDIRISSHGNIVDDPFDYGYNEPVVEAFPKAPRPRADRLRRGPRAHRRDTRRLLHRLPAGDEPPRPGRRQEAAVPPAHGGVPA